ncbi:unnamed protein product, partial [Rotaria sp. Silwood1]
FGLVVRLVTNESDMLADVLGRNNVQNSTKQSITGAVFKPVIVNHNLLVAKGYEHERDSRILNPAFHHTNLKSMVSIIVDRITKCISSL